MRTTLRSRLAISLAAASILAVPVAASPVTAAPTLGGTPTAELACKKAKIAGANKCIAAGQFCKKAAEKDYNTYGFTCNKKDANGRWHLQKK